MAYENILVEKRDGIGYVTINRPKVLNALSIKTVKELTDAFEKLAKDKKVGVVILTGSGEKSFVAGADIPEFAKLKPDGARDYAIRGQRLLNLIERLGKPVIAAVNGYALGGGCELAMACTIRIAANNALLGQPEVNLGLIPGYGGTQRLPRLVGKGRAYELILSAKPIDALAAERMGLVNKVVPQGDLMSTCEKMAKTIAKRGPLAVKYCLEAVDRGLNMSLDDGLALEADLFGLVFGSKDVREGVKAFTEKRNPDFKGK
ncbi:enoyl-CoA hydratase/isomerase family protein [Candidatus Eisenbacteria bacterium]|uniref:Enoyl-CoA hydratase/isomerase family protein n=1 Tax=Eiseniibacteriota bacterium TaxID=2212470 RepID=A0ABV6YN11_UNCEI